jgi:hypothetical protein
MSAVVAFFLHINFIPLFLPFANIIIQQMQFVHENNINFVDSNSPYASFRRCSFQDRLRKNQM